MIELKMVCQSTIHDSTNPEQGNAFLSAVTKEENPEYFACTPYGSLELGILNPKAFKQLIPGKTYRVTLELID